MKIYRLSVVGIVMCILFAGCAAKDMTLSNQGFKELSNGNYAAAEESLNSALSINPKNPYALLNLGVVYDNTGRYEQAKQMYLQAIRYGREEKAAPESGEKTSGKSIAGIAEKNLELLERKLDSQKKAPAMQQEAPKDETLQSSAGLRGLQSEPDRVLPSEPPPSNLSRKKQEAEPGKGVSAALPLAAAVEENSTTVPETSQGPAPEMNQEGIYRVKKGDTLYTIAGLREVYRDSLKWPSLFRLNMDALVGMKITGELQHKALSDGIVLRYFRPQEVIENRTKLGAGHYGINIGSARAYASLVPTAVKLMKNGYYVYIPEVEIKGQIWLRLRVGFFPNNSTASRAAKEIMSLLNMKEKPWVVKVSEDEMIRFSGY